MPKPAQPSATRKTAERQSIAATPSTENFSIQVIRWQRQHGRHDLPWQNTHDAYRIWLSEIMLQQTQVAAVLGYYARFLARFPKVSTLAQAPVSDVLQHWAGLGYYARARNLHRAAQHVMQAHDGQFPTTPEALIALPGVGRSTAAAIAVFSVGARAAILDGNVKRVLARCFGVSGFPGLARVEKILWQRAEQLLPSRGGARAMQAYTQGLMDLGATLCTRTKPACLRCPLRTMCVAHLTDRTAHLPTPRKKTRIPERHARWLVVLHGDVVLLEQRPATGLWGGLWSFPELHADETPTQAARRYGCVAKQFDALPTFRHSFTHFHLHVQALQTLLRGRRPKAPVQAAWVKVSDAIEQGVPTPVRTLLQRLPWQA